MIDFKLPFPRPSRMSRMSQMSRARRKLLAFPVFELQMISSFNPSIIETFNASNFMLVCLCSQLMCESIFTLNLSFLHFVAHAVYSLRAVHLLPVICKKATTMIISFLPPTALCCTELHNYILISCTLESCNDSIISSISILSLFRRNIE